ncbi:MAG: hypothetical protein DMG37_04635 [Acidobacteria bacterium]|nr:MAG: hypothetical protein DMG37_04635 [Acidobacteriota bacterium]
MWILKSIFLGVWLFGFGTIAFLWLAVYRHMAPHTAVDLRLIAGLTTQNPWWWASLVAGVILGCALVRSWPGKASVALWIFLFLTSIVPVGLFALFYVFSSKLKEIVGKP